MAKQFHNTLDSSTAIANSLVGVNGSVVGTITYASGKFGNGVSAGNKDNTYKFATVITPSQFNSAFTFRFFFKPNFASSSSTPSGICDFTDDTGDHQICVAYAYPGVGSAGKITVYCINESPARGAIYTFTPSSFSSGDLIHVAIIFDQSKGAGLKIRLFWNGTEITSPSVLGYGGDTAWNLTLNPNLRVSSSAFAFTSNCVFDNPIISLDTKTTFTDRLWQDEEGIPINIFASQGVYPDKVFISWDAVVADFTSGGYRVYRATSSGGSFSDISGLISSGESFDDATATPGVHYFYKVTSETSLAESDYSLEVEGYTSAAASPDTSFLVPTETLPTYNTKIIVGNIDLWQRGLVDRFPVIEYFRSFDRERLFINQLSINATNIDNLYSLDNPVSIYNNINWRGQLVRLYDPEKRLIWKGDLTNIIRDHGSWQADLISQNELYSYRYTKIVYASADWETGAQAILNILDLYGITNYDQNSFNMSNGILTDASALLKVTVTSANNKNLIDVLETIAKYSNADIFDYLGKIVMMVWRPSNQVLSQTKISDEDIIQSAKIEVMDKLIINDYSIAYTGDGGTPAKDEDNNDLGALSRERNGRYSFDLSGTEIVALKDLSTAVWVGEMAMKRTHRDFTRNPRGLMRCELSITMDSGVWVDLKTVLKLSLIQEAWNEKLFEVYRVAFDYETKIIGLELFELGS